MVLKNKLGGTLMYYWVKHSTCVTVKTMQIAKMYVGYINISYAGKSRIHNV